MNKLITTSAISLFVAASGLNAASLVAGWDFSNFTSSVSTVETLFGGATSIRSPYSDVSGDGLPSSNGRLYWDGTNGSSNLGNDGTQIAGTTVTLTANLNLGSDIRPLATYDNQPYTDKQVSRGVLLDQTASNDSITFEINALGGAAGSEASVYDSFDYAGSALNGGSSTIDWEYSIDDGSNWVLIGQDIVSDQGSTGAVFGGSLASAGTGNAGQLLLRATFGTITNTEEIVIDNVSVYGAVPEPSTYAALAGAVVLGFACLRRRRK